ncbi:hypothetical protein [Natribacillus halophilus]|uniref:Uncharacterized protein n=1 Tax=Natribacillus halophilus TaxID=549003 RepID=A0A1G8R4B5_9BACI|nr:hypothetical protein [Natribacillus halophilus]SDJ11797.1 hypothetical protein SAMN04488123_11557 [Natribacillus halophilus]
MAIVLLTAFVIAGILSVFTAFLMLVTWPERKQNRYKHAKYFSASFAAAIITLGTFLMLSDTSSTITANDSYEVPESVQTVEERAQWHITSELGQVTTTNHDVVQDITYDDETEVLEAQLITEDNVTTDLIRTSTLNRSAHVLQRMAEINELNYIHLVWDIYVEPESGPGEFDTIMDMTAEQDTLEDVEWNEVEVENIEDITEEYWEKPELYTTESE